MRLNIENLIKKLSFSPQPTVETRPYLRHWRDFYRFLVGAQDRTRTCTPYGTRPSNVCVYQFHHPSMSNEGKAD